MKSIPSSGDFRKMAINIMRFQHFHIDIEKRWRYTRAPTFFFFFFKKDSFHGWQIQFLHVSHSIFFSIPAHYVYRFPPLLCFINRQFRRQLDVELSFRKSSCAFLISKNIQEIEQVNIVINYMITASNIILFALLKGLYYNVLMEG